MSEYDDIGAALGRAMDRQIIRTFFDLEHEDEVVAIEAGTATVINPIRGTIRQVS